MRRVANWGKLLLKAWVVGEGEREGRGVDKLLVAGFADGRARDHSKAGRQGGREGRQGEWDAVAVTLAGTVVHKCWSDLTHTILWQKKTDAKNIYHGKVDLLCAADFGVVSNLNIKLSHVYIHMYIHVHVAVELHGLGDCDCGSE